MGPDKQPFISGSVCMKLFLEIESEFQKVSSMSWTSSERLMFVQFTSRVYWATMQCMAKNSRNDNTNIKIILHNGKLIISFNLLF